MLSLGHLVPSAQEIHERLLSLGPRGYTLALNVRYINPQFYITTYPDQWVAEYTASRYVLVDPVALWCAANTGTTRWSDVKVPFLAHPTLGVLARARAYGMNYGAVSSQRNPEHQMQRCALSLCRSDRELSDEEIQEVHKLLQKIMVAVGPFAGLNEEHLKVLQMLGAGAQILDIATGLNLSEATVKRRIDAAKKLLGAKTATHAVAIAAMRNLIALEKQEGV